MGKACKRYLEMVKNLGKEAVSRKPCPYEGCGSDHVWFWGWFERKGGAVPLDIDEVAEAIPIRRFQCQACGRCFSWRPAFLVFARRFAAATYQRVLKDLALNRETLSRRNWYEVGLAGLKSFRQSLHPDRLAERLKGRFPVDWPRLWYWLRHRAKTTTEPSQLAIHTLCLGLARHPDGTRYSLRAR